MRWFAFKRSNRRMLKNIALSDYGFILSTHPPLLDRIEHLFCFRPCICETRRGRSFVRFFEPERQNVQPIFLENPAISYAHVDELVVSVTVLCVKRRGFWIGRTITIRIIEERLERNQNSQDLYSTKIIWTKSFFNHQMGNFKNWWKEKKVHRMWVAISIARCQGRFFHLYRCSDETSSSRI